jgi:hypothetical protein
MIKMDDDESENEKLKHFTQFYKFYNFFFSFAHEMLDYFLPSLLILSEDDE